jgi:DNA-directed RNA polymerase specialized sigma24 family protein
MKSSQSKVLSSRDASAPVRSKIAIMEQWPTSEDALASNNKREQPAIFAARFLRCRGLLHFIACRVLGGPNRSEDAIANCWLTASRNLPTFEYEGAFRSWLLRILIDEALVILRRDNSVNREPITDCDSSVRRTEVANLRSDSE